MKHLLIMRHAKSSWSDENLVDIDRPLNQRGRLASVLMGQWISELDLAVDHVLLSPALRVQESWENVHPMLPKTERVVESKERIYMGRPDDMLTLLRDLPSQSDVCLMIGHQPGLSALVRRMTGGTASSASRSFSHFPTAAVALLKLDIDEWSDLRASGAEYKIFACPKELV